MHSYILYRIVRIICAIIFKICFRFCIEGKDNIPKEGSFIVASNHTSYLDPVAVAISIPEVLRFMARDDLFNIRFFGTFLRKMGVFPVRRGYQGIGAIKESLKLLKGEEAVAIFPEGSRIEGPELGEPELGIGMLAAHSNVPVLPVFVKGTDKALPKSAKFIKLRPVRVYIGKPLKFEEDKDILKKKQAYREFSNKVMESILALKQMHETKD